MMVILRSVNGRTIRGDALASPRITQFSFDEFNFAGLPCLVEPGVQRPIKTQCNEPAFSGHRLNPVSVLALGCLRRKIQVNRTILIDVQFVPLVVSSRKRLAGL